MWWFIPLSHQIVENMKNAGDMNPGPQRSRALGGVVLIVIGLLFFARKLGIEFPDWLFTWPMLLIALGIYISAKHNFKNPGGFILMIIGGVFLTERFYPDFRIHEFFWPTFLIVMGVVLLFKPRRTRNIEDYSKWDEKNNCYGSADSTDQTIEVNSILAGVKRNILSKDFKGGEVNCVMGGAELNFMHAQIVGTAVLEMNQVFGGAKLIVPANWEIISEITVVLGGVEDKRQLIGSFSQEQKPILILKGACVFGGIDIRSY